MSKVALLKVAVSAALLGIFLWRTPLDLVVLNLRHLDPAAFAAAAVLSFIAWWLSGVRLWCLLPEFRLGTLQRATFASLFYAVILPGQIAGDVVKAYRLGRQSTRTGHAEAATVVDRALAIFALFCLGAAATFDVAAIPSALRALMLCGAAAIALCGVVMASTRVRDALHRRGAGDGRLRHFLRHFAIALHDCLRKPSRMLANFLLALVFHAVCIAIQMLLGQALGIALSWSQWTIVHAGVTLVVLLPISVAGIGLREGGYVGMLALFGVPATKALPLSLTIFAMTLFGAAIGGMLELTSARARRDAAAPRSRTMPPRE